MLLSASKRGYADVDTRDEGQQCQMGRLSNETLTSLVTWDAMLPRPPYWLAPVHTSAGDHPVSCS